MRGISSVTLLCVLFVGIPSAWAQRTTKGRGPFSNSSDASGLVGRMMRFDADQDGKLTRDEVTDERSLATFDRADTNEDGTVTKAELSSLAAKERSNVRGNNRAGRGRFGDGFAEGGPGGMGPGGPPPKPGEVLPQMIQNHLKLTSDQKSQIKDLQNEVDARLAKILTDQQKAQLEEIQSHGPPGGGPPPGRFGDGGPPPGGFGDGGPPPPPDF